MRSRPARSTAPAAVSGRTRLLRQVLAGVLTALSLVPVTTAVPAYADQAITGTSQFHGVNWARIGDNFSTGPLVPQGLNLTDGYRTVRAKSGAMLDAFRGIGANTVRLPVNPASVDTSASPDWWDSYTGAIDEATAKGFNVILSYWEEGPQGGKIVDLSTWNRMWDTVIARYRANPRVYFDPMNEPRGYTTADWMNIAAKWLSDRPSVPRDRIIIAGGGFDWDIQPVCHDHRFDGTYLAFHHYYWDPDVQNLTTYDEWAADLKNRLAGCSQRTMLEEFGATMDSGLDFDDPAGTDQQVLYLRAYTDTVRSLHMGSVYWAGIGGRYLASDGTGAYETLNVQRLSSATVNTPLWTPNPTGLDRLQYGWGIGSGSSTTALRNDAGHRCLTATGDDAPASTGPCRDRIDQQWARTATGQITVHHGAGCLDAGPAGSPAGTRSCTGGETQKWLFFTDGTIRSLPSGLCLDAGGRTAGLELRACHGAESQSWSVVRH